MTQTQTAIEIHLPDADATRALGAALASLLRAGDLLVLTGDLGAGKTTLTQGIGTGLGVRGQVASPTFVIAREHPPLGEGPGLVHVDAYRLGGLEELDALDLDSSLEESVTVVEWGEGLARTSATTGWRCASIGPAGRGRARPQRERWSPWGSAGPAWTSPRCGSEARCGSGPAW